MIGDGIRIPDFDTITGNWLCLNFTHTLEGRYDPQPRELLNSYSDLVAWGLYEHHLTHEEAKQLLKKAEKHPAEASAALERAINSREAIYRLFYAISESSTPQKDDLALVNTMLTEALAHACIVPQGNGFIWSWTEKEHSLDYLLWLVVRSAADLLTSEKLQDVHACAAEDCRWLFLDTSKNHSRRWCDMQTCGNQAKVRKHYSRKKQAVSKS